MDHPPRAPTPHWVFGLGRAERSRRAGRHANRHADRSEGGTGPPRRVDNLRTEWLFNYLFILIHRWPPLALGVTGTLEPPDDPTRHSCPTKRVCDAPMRRPAAQGVLERDPVGCRVLKNRGRLQRKESSSKGLRENKHRNINYYSNIQHNIQPPRKPLTKKNNLIFSLVPSAPPADPTGMLTGMPTGTRPAPDRSPGCAAGCAPRRA